jgi:energy-coupling factor transporter ATP-binding protein EcfA2
MKLKKIILKNNTEVNVGKFTVLVGPNNVGKSRTLRDIQAIMTNPSTIPTILVRSLLLEKPPKTEQLFGTMGVTATPDPQTINQFILRGMGATSGHEIRISKFFEEQLATIKTDDEFTTVMISSNLGNFCLSYMDAASRLNAAQSTGSFNPHAAPPASLLQALFKAGSPVEQRLEQIFKQTFGMEIRLDYSAMQTLVLRIADKFEQIPADPREAFPVFEKYDRLDDQGDGYRSFVGVVLSVLLAEARIVLLDEPEAFLHPAQARALGRWLANYSKSSDVQIIIATHNANFLSGIISNTDEVDLYRLNRSANATTFTRIEAHVLSELVRSPLLLSQRVLEAIFFRGVAICEADADRVIYQTVASRIIGFQELLFVHAHNKQTIKSVVKLLKAASIPVCAISDIDILNSRSEMLELIRALDPTAAEGAIGAQRDEVAAAIEGKTDDDLLREVRKSVAELSDQLNRGEHTISGVKGALSRVYKEASKWSEVKRAGLQALSTTARTTAQQLLAKLADAGLFVVPVGELESWIDTGTLRKNRWIVKALESLSNNNCPVLLQTFVERVGQFLGESIVTSSKTNGA